MFQAGKMPQCMRAFAVQAQGPDPKQPDEKLGVIELSCNPGTEGLEVRGSVKGPISKE